MTRNKTCYKNKCVTIKAVLVVQRHKNIMLIICRAQYIGLCWAQVKVSDRAPPPRKKTTLPYFAHCTPPPPPLKNSCPDPRPLEEFVDPPLDITLKSTAPTEYNLSASYLKNRTSNFRFYDAAVLWPITSHPAVAEALNPNKPNQTYNFPPCCWRGVNPQ